MRELRIINKLVYEANQWGRSPEEVLSRKEFTEYQLADPKRELDFCEVESNIINSNRGEYMKMFVSDQDAFDNLHKYAHKFAQVVKSKNIEAAQDLMLEYRQELDEHDIKCKRFFFPILRKDDPESIQKKIKACKDNVSIVAKMVNESKFKPDLEYFLEKLAEIGEDREKLEDFKTELEETFAKATAKDAKSEDQELKFFPASYKRIIRNAVNDCREVLRSA